MDLPNNVMQIFRRFGPEQTKDGIITVGQRMSKRIEDNWNQSTFALLPTNHAFTGYVVKSIHEEDHAGIDVTLAKIRSRF